MIRSRSQLPALMVLACLFWVLVASPRAIAQDSESTSLESSQDDESAEVAHRLAKGKSLYVQQCASCHGANGEGGTDGYDEPLYGDRSLADLTRVIEETMPEEEPDLCQGADAALVAEFMYGAFYTDEARAKMGTARVEMSRLTVRQYQSAVTDLFGRFIGQSEADDRRGLSGTYYNSRNFSRKEMKIERIDGQIDFDFGEQSPDPDQIGTKEFSMSWNGSVIAEETGEYEFIVRSQNGIRLYLNSDEALIDGWVNSGEMIVEHRESVYLLAGRAYPVVLQFFSYEDDSASIQLLWKTPHGTEEVIPTESLSPKRVPASFIVSTQFPADDSSVGYARGTSVSKLWDEATTYAAIEAANYAVKQIDRLSNSKEDSSDRRDKVQAFCRRFVETAFRRPLQENEADRYVTRHFAADISVEEALKRVVLLTLKSPNFLYLEWSDGELTDYDIASRLSFGLWDSIPDQNLIAAAQRNQLNTPKQIEQQVRRMLNNPRTKAKLKNFFHHWLLVEEADDLSKDAEQYPEFTEAIVADLRRSLDMFIDGVVWSDESDYRQLLLADYLVFNRELADFYGLEFGEGDGFQRVAAPDGTRAGVLTHPLMMSALAYHKSTSPIHRGVFVTRNVLSRSLNPPPEAIEFLDDRFDPTLTMREKVAQLTEPDACQSCHRIINPLGFSLEHYDAVGRFRTIDQDKPIDPNGVYETTSGDKIKLSGARDLAEFAAEDTNAQQGFVEQLFQQTVKQPVRAYGDSTLDDLTNGFRAKDYSIKELLVQIMVTTATFEQAQTDRATAATATPSHP